MVGFAAVALHAGCFLIQGIVQGVSGANPSTADPCTSKHADLHGRLHAQMLRCSRRTGAAVRG